MSLSRGEAIDQKMNQLARQAMLNVIEQHVNAIEIVMTHVGHHLHNSDLSALLDHRAAMERTVKALGASGL